MEDITDAKSYEEDFDPELYVEQVYKTNVNKDDGFESRIEFSLDCFHEAFKKGEIGGETLLDIRTGPTVHTVISASRHVTEIHLSNLVDRNRYILQKWMAGESYDIPTFQYILDKENEGTKLEDRLAFVRNRVTEILPIDLRFAEPLPGSRIKYDVIVASLSLSTVAKDKKDFENVVTKVTAMMKEKSHLLIVGVLNGHSYRVGKVRFNNPNLSRYVTREVLMNAGLQIVSWKEMGEGGYNKLDKHFTDVDDFYFAVCRKVE